MFPNYDRSERIGKRVLFSTVCLGLFFFIPAAIFQAIEDWTYLEAWYYTVVTLTTVGFGDFVPGKYIFVIIGSVKCTIFQYKNVFFKDISTLSAMYIMCLYVNCNTACVIFESKLYQIVFTTRVSSKQWPFSCSVKYVKWNKKLSLTTIHKRHKLLRASNHFTSVC